jgi:hypothetical protein
MSSRKIRAEAKKAASAASASTDVEPAYLRVIDHEAGAEAAATTELFDYGSLLASMGQWLQATPVQPPAPGSFGPAARHQAEAAAAYLELTRSATLALYRHDQTRDNHRARLDQINQARLARRRTFLAAYIEYDAGGKPASITETPTTAYELPPEHPHATETRRRLHQLHRLLAS